MKSCNLCQKVNAAFKCSVCKNVWYCSSAHQQADWPKHKREECDQQQIEVTYEAREREKIASHLKTLADRFSSGEGPMSAILEYALKSMTAVESKNALMRYGFQPVKQLANIEQLADQD